MNWSQVFLGILGVVALYILYMLAASGLPGLIIALVLIGVGIYLYVRQKDQDRVINPITVRNQRLIMACLANRRANLKYLYLTGDKHNQKILKGRILGGPVFIRHYYKVGDGSPKPIPRTNPKWLSFVFYYTPTAGWLYDIPLIGWILNAIAPKALISVYEEQLESKYMIGYVGLRGCNTSVVAGVEYMNDILFDYDELMEKLSTDVDRIVLEDNLSQQALRMRKAIDSNPIHNMHLDDKDTMLGGSGST